VYWYIDQPGFQGGSHDVFIKWLQPDGEGSSTNYNVRVSGESTHRIIVQHDQHSRGDWVFLGNFDFAPAGSSLSQYVSLTGFDNRFGSEGSYLEADAVKIVPTIVPDGYLDLKYIHNDHLGTPQIATDGSGQIVWSASYKPFGEATVDEDPDGDGTDYSLNIRFPGQYHDAESGLHYNYFRDYDPNVGRYIESDPIGLRGALNTFTYVGSDPINAIDPSGLVKLYGSWCGPNWTGGFRRSYDELGPIERSVVLPAIDILDQCCQVHDITYADCRSKYPCEAKSRQQCFQDADRQLSSCAANAGGGQSPQFLIFGNPQDRIEDYMRDSIPDAEENAEACACN
jgi:RHS repeat-associated protein